MDDYRRPRYTLAMNPKDVDLYVGMLLEVTDPRCTEETYYPMRPEPENPSGWTHGLRMGDVVRLLRWHRTPTSMHWFWKANKWPEGVETHASEEEILGWFTPFTTKADLRSL